MRVLDALESGVVVVDLEQRVVLWNAWVEAASGITADQARGKTLSEVFPGHRNARLEGAIRQAMESGASSLLTNTLHSSLFPLRTRTGQDLIHSVTVKPVGQKPYPGCLVQIQDVTVSVQRERVLRERQNARYDAVVESAPDPILTMDSSGVIQVANPAAARQFGYPQSELIGKDVALLFEGDTAWERAWAEILELGDLDRPLQLVARRKDGTPSYLEASAGTWRTGSVGFITAILRDVNERHRAEEALRRLNDTLEQRVEEIVAEREGLEEALRQAQKMEAIGQLTGGIAHDFNNMLTGIIGAMDIMKRRLATRRYEDLPRFMDAASASANRAAALTHRLLAFARRQPLDPQAVSPNRLVEGMEELLRRTLGERVKLKFALGQDLWPTLCDPHQLENAVLNLAINARDAMPEGGILTVETRNAVLTGDEWEGAEGVPAGDYAVVTVCDTGLGMDPDVVARVFEPFFTTKPLGEGTGLGLSMIYGFVRQSRGQVRIDSRVGEGTAVSLFLPRYHGDLVAQNVRPEQHGPQGSGETVLLVEDDSAVRLLIGELLRELDYSCIEASDAQAALPILQSNARLDLMITDIGLPGMDGRQLADVARGHRPGLKVLFVTGYAEHATGREEFLAPGMAMVTKPFALDALALRIREMIGMPHTH